MPIFVLAPNVLKQFFVFAVIASSLTIRFAQRVPNVGA
jgi:hypothetical protein